MKMNKNLKRFLAFLLCAAMLITYTPSFAFTYADEGSDEPAVSAQEESKETPKEETKAETKEPLKEEPKAKKKKTPEEKAPPRPAAPLNISRIIFRKISIIR